ncbi:MAG: ATP-dependent zinc metalloprotease FtsH [Clostridiales bacterium]|nr:ATP-dependent zinc metalloprotease FtsH [Clostridiales bacterium]
MDNKRNNRGINILFYIVLFMSVLAYVTYYNMSAVTPKNYSDLYHSIKNEQVTTLSYTATHATAELKSGTKISVSIPSIDVMYQDLGDSINKQQDAGTLKVIVDQPSEMPWWFSMLPTLALVAFLVFTFFYMQRITGGGGKGPSFGRSKAKRAASDTTAKKTTFEDVAGADESKEELEEVVEFLKHPDKFTNLGARIPRGVLLVGPPGTGKTLLAKAVAGEAGVPFFSISGSDFVEMFVGVGASRVRDLFNDAKKESPSIVFIDEIDAVGRHRGAGMGGGHDEREQTLNQLLVEMDGFGVNQGVIIIAATNRPDILDPALLRPGRFDRQVTVGIPDIKGRREILDVHVKGKKLDKTVSLDNIAKTTTGFTGADIENLCNEAALLAARRELEVIDEACFQDAIIKVIAGPEKKARVMSDKERELTAFHEAGHAVVTKLCSTQHPVHQVSIIPRGRAGGYTMSLPTEDKHYTSKNEMLENIITLLGGRVSEEIVLDDVSTGASNDLERATKIAHDMVAKYGMSKNVGAISWAGESDEVFLGRGFAQSKNYSETTATMIDNEVKAILDSCYEKCRELINDNRDKLNAVAKALLDHEKLDGDEFEKIMKVCPKKASQ